MDPLKPIGQPALYVVATPIGNLGDISRRAVEVLADVDLIAAEDTRHSGRLLQHIGVRTPMWSYHAHSREERETSILERLESGQSVALISDAGTPLVSDPGEGLVRRAAVAGIPVIPVPGASAVITALSVAGLPVARFCFEGFPPARAAARRRCFRALRAEQRTLVFYEAPHRIRDSIADMATEFGGGRRATICRELTKTWESVARDTLGGLVAWLEADDNNRRGEFVVVVAGCEPPSDDEEAEEDARAREVLRLLLADGLSVRRAAALGARLTGGRKNRLYSLALELAGD